MGSWEAWQAWSAILRKGVAIGCFSRESWIGGQPSFHEEGTPPPSSKEEDAQPFLIIDNNKFIMVRVRGRQRQPYPLRRDAAIELPRRDVVIPSFFRHGDHHFRILDNDKNYNDNTCKQY